MIAQMIFLCPDVIVPKRWLYSDRNPEGKRVIALSFDGQDNVQQKLVYFHASTFH
jgi:hypothetical protein